MLFDLLDQQLQNHMRNLHFLCNEDHTVSFQCVLECGLFLTTLHIPDNSSGFHVSNAEVGMIQ